MKKNLDSANNRSGINNPADYKAPVLFEIPLSDYADEVIRKRNKAWYNKMKRMEEKSKELRLTLQNFTERNCEMIEKTRQLLDLAAAIQKNFLARKNALNNKLE